MDEWAAPIGVGLEIGRSCALITITMANIGHANASTSARSIQPTDRPACLPTGDDTSQPWTSARTMEIIALNGFLSAGSAATSLPAHEFGRHVTDASRSDGVCRARAHLARFKGRRSSACCAIAPTCLKIAYCFPPCSSSAGFRRSSRPSRASARPLAPTVCTRAHPLEHTCRLESATYLLSRARLKPFESGSLSRSSCLSQDSSGNLLWRSLARARLSSERILVVLSSWRLQVLLVRRTSLASSTCKSLLCSLSLSLSRVIFPNLLGRLVDARPSKARLQMNTARARS